MLNLSSNKRKLMLSTMVVSAFLVASTTISYASKSNQMKLMKEQIESSLSPEEWPIRFSVISDNDGLLKVWLGGTERRLNAKKGKQHYLSYNEKIKTNSPLFEVKALINGKRIVCKTKAGEQIKGSFLVRGIGDTISKSAKKIASQEFLQAIKITISGEKCIMSPSYKVLTSQNPWDEDIEY